LFSTSILLIVQLDSRVNQWFLMPSACPTYIIGFAYVLAIVFGRQWMKNRNPFALRTFMFIYNFIQVVLCAYITYEV